MASLNEVFKIEKPVIAMLHSFKGNLSDQTNQALEDLERLQPYVDGVMTENYGWGYRDNNYADSEAFTNLVSITREVRRKSKIPVGINVLPNDYVKAFRIADITGARFVQLDHVTGRFEGRVSVEPENLNTIRRTYSDVTLLGGIHPKYYTLKNPDEPITDAAKIAKDLTDAIVVTGQHTGGETDSADLLAVKDVVGNHPVIIGSGLTKENAAYQMRIADGAIVGSAFKPKGVRPGSKIDEELVKELMEQVKIARSMKTLA